MQLLTALLAASTATAASIDHVAARALAEPTSMSLFASTLTSKWLQGSNLEQVVELVVQNNDHTNPLTAHHNFTVTVQSSQLKTTTPGKVVRLLSNQTAIIQVGVQNVAGTATGSNCNANVVGTWGTQSKSTSQSISGICGIPDYAPTTDSLGHHWIPDWLREAKYGIFFHWGLYSAPAYGDGPGPNQDYAEWYWFRMDQPGFRTNTYEYHNQTYGENFAYDDFMSNFTAAKFDAKQWTDLVANAGAKYFVPVTKHHDGWSIFDQPANITKRTFAQYGPKRDFLQELFDTSKANHPEIHRGTYVSMPEWYNPAYAAKYAFDQHYEGNYFGRDPTNPYTNASIPYTGYVPVDDYIDDIQNPQIELLFYKYNTELLWCDIGGANKAPDVIAPWLNSARKQGRQVSWNDRCGIPGDFATPEYAGPALSSASYESNRGVDPFSFGYNYNTQANQYMSAQEIVTDLINTVVTNGNLLLNVGPMHDGSFPTAPYNNMLSAGSWIRSHGEAIYATRIWNTAQVTNNYRYTTKPGAFYIHNFGQPASTLTFTDPIPWLAGDVVTAVGGSANGTVIKVSKNSNGNVVFNLPSNVVNGDQWVWTFKIAYSTAT